MDTNVLALLLAALQEKQGVPVATQDGRTLIMVASMVLAAISPVLAAMATYYAKKVAVVVEKVHTAVNSERSAMLETVKGLRDEVLRVNKELATMIEKQRERAERDTRQEERNERRDMRADERASKPQEKPQEVAGDNSMIARLDALLAKYEAPLVVSVKKPK